MRRIAALALAVAVPGAVVVARSLHHDSDPTTTSALAPKPIGAAPALVPIDAAPARVAAAYGYPARCLRVVVSASDPAYASAHVDRRRACRSYRGYVNASFHLVRGAWRLVLDEGQLFVPNGLLVPAEHRGHAPMGRPR